MSYADSNKKLNQCPDSPNCAQTLYPEHKSFVQPLTASGEQAKIDWVLLRSIILAQPGTKLAAESPGYIKVEFQSRLFKFVDDVEFLLDKNADKVDMRSASRAGYYDFNVNKKRLEKIKTLYKEALATEPHVSAHSPAHQKRDTEEAKI